jgi:sulfur-oxidizing protein SoxY
LRRKLMSMNIKRRVFLKGSLAAGTVGVAVGAGLLAPQAVVAAWNEKAFKAESVDDALAAAMGEASNTASDAIKIKAPDIAENGAVVPVSVSTDMADVESIALLAEGNNTPLVATFTLGEGAIADVSTRIKMGKTSDVIAIVKSGGKLHSARKSVKVTIGGCGG